MGQNFKQLMAAASFQRKYRCMNAKLIPEKNFDVLRLHASESLAL